MKRKRMFEELNEQVGEDEDKKARRKKMGGEEEKGMKTRRNVCSNINGTS